MEKSAALSYYNQGNTHKKEGNLLEAYKAFCESAKLDMDNAQYHMAVAVTACEIAKQSDTLRATALAHAQYAARIDPDNVMNWIALGEIALADKKYPDAVAAFEMSFTKDDKNWATQTLCGFAYQQMMRISEAKKHYEKAIALNPEAGHSHFLLSCLYSDDEYNPAKQAFYGERGFMAQQPAKLAVESCWNSAHGYLGIAEYEKGWRYFESRLNRNMTNQNTILPSQRFSVPMWDGKATGKVYIFSEMGYGDMFLMARYFHILPKDCQFVFECPKNMLSFMQKNFPHIECISGDPQYEGKFDYYLPMMSLPLKTGRYYYNTGKYLNADRQLVEEWREKLCLTSSDKLNIGLCWNSGRNSYSASNHETSKRKSVSFDLIRPLLDIDRTRFFALQVERNQEMPDLGIRNFDDTAAIIQNMDIVISVDSAVANLTGALGKRLWLMDRYDHCWRWNDPDSVWYERTKIFRQQKAGDWSHVGEQLYFSLKEICGNMAA